MTRFRSLKISLSTEAPHNIFEAYMIQHSAFWLTTSNQIDSWGWGMALEAHERFSVGVAVQIAKVVVK